MRFSPVLLCFVALFLGGCDRHDQRQFNGYIEGENIFLASPFYGVLEHLAVQRGQHVEKGALLFRLDSKPQLFNIAQVQGELEQAEQTLADLKKPRRTPEIDAIQAQIEQTDAQIKLAEIRVSRFQKLFEKQATDRDSLDAALANLQQQQELKAQYQSNLALANLGSRDEQIKAQEAQIESLRAKLHVSQWELAQKTITAPESGVIFDTYFRTGEFVMAQQSVVSLLTPANVQIEFFVPLEYLAKIKVGEKITFNCVGCAKDNNATINYVSPEAEFLPPLVYSRDNDANLVFRIKAHINQPLAFKPGQPVQVTLP